MGLLSNRDASGASSLRRIVTGNYTMLAIPAFLGSMAVEYLALRRKADVLVELDDPTTESNTARPLGYEARDTLASLAMGAGMLAIGVAASKAFDPLDRWLYRRRLASLGSRRFGFAAAVLAWDFFYYWDHRWGHEHRVFWAAHVNHHSSRRYNLSTALRQSWTGAMMHWVFTPMFAMGFSPAQVARAGELNLLYQYWVHTETIDKLPRPVEMVFSTASHHRVHHGADPQYLDRNYGGILILWDRLFGSFEPEVERVHYGLTKNIDTFNPVRIAYHEWADIIRDLARSSSWRERVGYTFGPPGWAANA
ncbi:MAG: sterol desaturase family protein [Acidimicrobiia bacterium]|nr:sterol desaturase family protein [Acidimicrobiia bacterium]